MPITDDQLNLLKSKLESTFVPLLPPLLDTSKPVDHQRGKNVSRAFSAFVLKNLCDISEIVAALAVVDDYDDNGIDAIYYHQPSCQLFLVQTKLKKSEPFSQQDALAFAKGTRDLLRQDYLQFNTNVQSRQHEIDAALENCSQIVLVVAHANDSFSTHANRVMQQLIDQRDDVDERLHSICDYGPAKIVEDLLEEHSIQPIDDSVVLHGSQRIETPRLTYFGRAKVKDLASLYTKHGNSLFQRNIRYYLGSSSVNRAIYASMKERPELFFYLNNGITAVAREIHPRGNQGGGRRLEAKGLSVVNGAQTIAAASEYLSDVPESASDDAWVLVTLIQASGDQDFLSEITKARNFQNPTASTNFAALDPEQERLRRELAFLGIDYYYRQEWRQPSPDGTGITIEDAAAALALFSASPDYPIILKRDRSRLLDIEGADYKALFIPDRSGIQVAIAVTYYRKALEIMNENEQHATGPERLFYKHGKYGIIWLVLHQNWRWLNMAEIPDVAGAGAEISAPLDSWRQLAWDAGQKDLAAAAKGPLAFFKSMTDAKPFLLKVKNSSTTTSELAT